MDSILVRTVWPSPRVEGIVTNRETQRLEKLLAKFDQLADARCARLAKWFGKKFQRHSLQITFGMGSELIQVDGRTLWLDGEPSGDFRPVLQFSPGKGNYGRRCAALKPIQDAMEDVWDITDSYRRGCPNDINVQPR